MSMWAGAPAVRVSLSCFAVGNSMGCRNVLNRGCKIRGVQGGESCGGYYLF